MPLVSTGMVARLVPSTRKLTVPVGTAVLGAWPVTTAVKVTGAPKMELPAEATLRLLPASWMVWVNVGEVAGLKFESPPYDAEMLWLPLPSAFKVKVALPAMMATAGCETPSMLKTTVPVGTPDD